MSTLKELYLITKELYDHLQNDLPESMDERDAYIEEIHKFIHKREQLLANLQTVKLDENGKKLAEVIMKLDTSIKQILQKEKGLIQRDLANIKIKKKTKAKYENPYDGPTVEGIYFDKRNI